MVHSVGVRHRCVSLLILLESCSLQKTFGLKYPSDYNLRASYAVYSLSLLMTDFTVFTDAQAWFNQIQRFLQTSSPKVESSARAHGLPYELARGSWR